MKKELLPNGGIVFASLGLAVSLLFTRHKHKVGNA